MSATEDWSVRGAASVGRHLHVVDERDAASVERLVVVADDGVSLHVEIEGDPDAPVTVVLSHGFLLDSTSWLLQRAALKREVRVVSWDHRGHGRSGRGRPEHSSIDQTGRDLLAVLEQVVPEGPVVLVGHSMGGMTIMALAEQEPQLFGDRVVGAVLIATSAGPVPAALGRFGIGADVITMALRRGLSLLRFLPGPIGLRGRPARALRTLLALSYAFASEVPRPVRQSLMRMINATPIDVATEFFPHFAVNYRFAGLRALNRTKCVLLAAERDVITPPSASGLIARAMPSAEFIVVPGAGHAVMLERAEAVNACLATMLAEVRTTDTRRRSDRPLRGR